MISIDNGDRAIYCCPEGCHAQKQNYKSPQHDLLCPSPDPAVVCIAHPYHQDKSRNYPASIMYCASHHKSHVAKVSLQQIQDYKACNAKRANQADHSPGHPGPVDAIQQATRFHWISHLLYSGLLRFLSVHPLAYIGMLLLVNMSQHLFSDRRPGFRAANLIRQFIQIFFRLHAIPPCTLNTSTTALEYAIHSSFFCFRIFFPSFVIL